MPDRRSVLAKLVSTVIGSVLAIAGVTAQSDTVSVDVTITNDADTVFAMGPNDGFAGTATEFVTDATDSVDFSAAVSRDSKTTFEGLLTVENESGETDSVRIVDDAGSNGVLDFRIGSDSVVVGSRDEDGGVELAPGERAAMSVVVDVTEHGGGSITDTVTLVADSASGGGGDIGCVITTATASEPETLATLRRFRDESMAATPLGRGLVALYYRVGPPVAATLARHPESRTRWTVRRIVRGCASLADRQDRTDSRVASAVIAAGLTVAYIGGTVVGIVGHLGIRLRERLQRL